MHLPRIVISAPHRSSGKTTVSIGLCAALAGAGLAVQPFKKGPDFIDPMWLSAAANRECRNLDLFMMGDEEIVKSVSHNAADAGAAVIEGNMGLFDSIDVEGRGSTSDLARQLKAPVILVVNTRNMTRSIAPLVQGFTQFEPDINIAGVILNMVSAPGMRTSCAPYWSIIVTSKWSAPFAGAPRSASSRGTWGCSRPVRPWVQPRWSRRSKDHQRRRRSRPRAGHRRDGAGTAGHRTSTARIPRPRSGWGRPGPRLSPSTIRKIWKPCASKNSNWCPSARWRTRSCRMDGLYIGGGFPEVFMEELEANRALRGEIKAAIEAGMPVYAECGGLMYLSGTMLWQGQSREDGRRAPL